MPSIQWQLTQFDLMVGSIVYSFLVRASSFVWVECIKEVRNGVTKSEGGLRFAALNFVKTWADDNY